MAEISLKEIEEFPVLMMRRRTSLEGLKEVISDGFMKIATYLEYLGESPAGPPYAAYYNNEMNDLDIEIGFPVVSPLPGQGAIHGSFVRAYTAVECLHKGPYSKFSETYGEMIKWMESHDLSPAGAYYEAYLNSPGDTPESELLTVIRISVK
jgi:effector-binding domain-containing protein